MMQENTGDQEHQKNRPGPMPQHFTTPRPCSPIVSGKPGPTLLIPLRMRVQAAHAAVNCRGVQAVGVSFPLVLCAARSVRYRRSSRMMLGGAGGVRMSCGLRPVGLLRSCGLARVRSCGFDGLTFGACPTVPGCAVFERASGPLRGVLPGSASGLLLGLLGDAEGLTAEASTFTRADVVEEGLAAGAPPVAPVPAPVEPLAPPELPVPPELLCANAIPPDSSRVASTAAEATFMAISILGS